MKALEAAVRGIEQDGLVWGGGKLVAVGFGIKKLQINCVVEDDKVSMEELQETIEGFEDYVQSSDVAGKSIPSSLFAIFSSATLITCLYLLLTISSSHFKPCKNFDRCLNATRATELLSADRGPCWVNTCHAWDIRRSPFFRQRARHKGWHGLDA
jgi:translation elongation factor EF-1beta